jgi:hypothetical protein
MADAKTGVNSSGFIFKHVFLIELGRVKEDFDVFLHVSLEKN